MEDRASEYAEKRKQVLVAALNGGVVKAKDEETIFFETFLKGELERAFKAGVAEATTIRSPHELDEKPAQRT